MLYTTQPPDSGWTNPQFDDSGWSVGDFSQIPELSHRGSFYLRFERDLEWREINNSYFRARHRGAFEIWVNGQHKLRAGSSSSDWRDYTLDRRRAERIGRNVYALRFEAIGDGESWLEIEPVVGDWVEVEVRTARIAPVLSDKIRDASAMRGPDGAYYLTGTTGPEEFFGEFTPRGWLLNDGIQVFRSLDARNWRSLGWVWSFERDGTWNRDFGTFNGRGPARAVFAPKIHFLRGKWWISYCVNSHTPTHSFGVSLLCADAPEGPYTDVSPLQPLDNGFDANLFEEPDGSVWMMRNHCLLARLNADMNALAEPLHQMSAANFPHVGFEGASMFQHQGRFFLCAAEWNIHADGSESYDCMIASALSPAGPYGNRYLALRYGGHNSFFRGEDGALYATVWANPHAYEQVSIVRMEWDDEGRLGPCAQECENDF